MWCCCEEKQRKVGGADGHHNKIWARPPQWQGAGTQEAPWAGTGGGGKARRERSEVRANTQREGGSQTSDNRGYKQGLGNGTRNACTLHPILARRSQNASGRAWVPLATEAAVTTGGKELQRLTRAEDFSFHHDNPSRQGRPPSLYSTTVPDWQCTASAQQQFVLCILCWTWLPAI